MAVVVASAMATGWLLEVRGRAFGRLYQDVPTLRNDLRWMSSVVAVSEGVRLHPPHGTWYEI